jgi:uncharacterized protein (TIGR02271 family)
MIRKQDIKQLTGARVFDRDGQKIGSVGQVYLDDSTGDPAWVGVRTGLFGGNDNFIPLDKAARLDGETLYVSVAKTAVQDSPQVEAQSGHLSQQSVAELYRHYNMSIDSRSTTGTVRGDRAANLGTMPSTGREETQADRRMAAARDEGVHDLNLTRYEEQIRVGKEQVESGHVKLRKHVITEEVGVTVPLEHEEIRIVREPFTGTPDSEHSFADDEVDVILHEERPVVHKESVPMETIGLAKETRTEQQSVRGTVRKERIDVVDSRSEDARATDRMEADRRSSRDRRS